MWRLPYLLIIAYRRWLSPLLPSACRFHPSCSAYAAEALRAHGLWRGGRLTVARLARCHPWHPGGCDPVPPAPPRRARAQSSGRRSPTSIINGDSAHG